MQRKDENMKKIILTMLAGLLVAACEKPILGEVEDQKSELGGVENNIPTKKFTFTVKGDFGNPTFTRAAGYLTADGKDMTDLWVFDYVDGICVQSLHQTADDPAWGKPVMQLAYGSHHVYFVVSRGEAPTLDTSSHLLTWERPSDTFWKDYDVNVVSTSNGNRAVTLDRVVTRLRLSMTDEVPANCATLAVTPNVWYYGWDYVAGVPAAQQHRERSVQVPASYVGTAGQLTMTVYGLSTADEWATDVTIEARDGNGTVIGSGTIVAAPFKSNRSTDYSGPLFGASGSLDISVNDEWTSAFSGTW